MRKHRIVVAATVLVVLTAGFSSAQSRRKVIINEDCSGPGGSNMQTLTLLIQSPQVEVLGITVVSGDQWRDEEVAHTLRLLEIMGRTDHPSSARGGLPSSS
jgi:purine nucleosidase